MRGGFKLISTLLLNLLLSCTIYAQSVNSDSLWGVWNDHNIKDSVRFRAIGKLAFYTLFTDPEKALYYSNIQLKNAIRQKDVFNQADAFNTQGAYYYFRGEYDKAILYFNKGLLLYKRIDDYENVGNILNNISGIYVQLKSYDEALGYLKEGLTYFQDSKYDIGLAMSYSNIGTVYVYKSEDVPTGKLQEKYLDSAYHYLLKGLNYSNKINYQQSKGNALSNLGVVHYFRNQMDSAYFYLNSSLALRRESENLEGTSEDLVYLSKIARKNGQLAQSIQYAQEALRIGEELDLLSTIKNASYSLYTNYKESKDYNQALIMHEKYLDAKEKLENDDNQKEVLRQQYRYEYEKQAAQDSITRAKDKKLDEIRIEKQKVQLTALWGGLSLIVIFALFIFNRFRVTKKQKRLIEDQKTVVEIAHTELESKNKEILDSINYAKRIQSAILPPPMSITNKLPESFVIYIPKDIVAGDFYWLETTEDELLIAAADCTGHGVPGAMVSVLCVNSLNRTVREHQITKPGQILDKTRELVIQEFMKSEDDVKDGMDISLCRLKGNNLDWAGANNPLWIIRNGELIEFKADKQPIGKTDAMKSFETHSFILEKGDLIYLFTDGFSDQFGGPDNKKYKSANFKKLLLKVSSQSIAQQKEMILAEFKEWKGEFEQLDDICIIGIRVE